MTRLLFCRLPAGHPGDAPLPDHDRHPGAVDPPSFPRLNTTCPVFPQDPYGFTLADRLKWSKISMEYLVNDQPIDWLANQKLPDGSPFYNRARTQPHAGREEPDPDHVRGLVDLPGAASSLAGLAAWRLERLRIIGRRSPTAAGYPGADRRHPDLCGDQFQRAVHQFPPNFLFAAIPGCSNIPTP